MLAQISQLRKFTRPQGDAMADESSANESAGGPETLAAPQEPNTQSPSPIVELEGIAELARRMEALLFVSSRPMSAKRLADLLELDSIVPIREAADYLNEQYAERAFELRLLAGGYQLLTRAALEPEVLKLQKQRKAQKLTPGALETLAIIAYKQPIPRQDIDNIRGVQSDHYIRQLAERHLIRVVGRGGDGSFGGSNPALYGTTTTFLDEFGLKSLKELPQEEDMLAFEAEEQAKKEAEEKAQREAEAAAQAEAEAAEEAEAEEAGETQAAVVTPEKPKKAPKKKAEEIFEDDDEDWPDTESEDEDFEDDDDDDGPGLEIIAVMPKK